MAVKRDNPYGAFNFIVEFGTSAQGGPIEAGFSKVEGLTTGISYAAYRNGNDKSNAPRKLAVRRWAGDVVLRRGLTGSTDLFEWIRSVFDGIFDPRTVTVTLLDEARNAVASWVLKNAQPSRWSGPQLNAESDLVAMEELVLVCDGITYE